MDLPLKIECDISNPYISSNAPSTLEIFVKIQASRAAPTINAPLASCLVIDKSGSMAGEKIKNVKNAIVKIMDYYGEDDIISIISFNQEVQVLVPPTFTKQRRKINRFIKKIKTNGRTSLYAALSQSIELMSKLKNVNPRILIFTDGLPTDVKEPEKYKPLSRNAFISGITISTIGVGYDYNDIILRAISDQGGGWWEHIRDLDKIENAFINEVENSKTTVTSQPHITLKLNKYAQIESAHMFKPIPKEVSLNLDEYNNPIIYVPNIHQGGVQEYIFKINVTPTDMMGEDTVVDICYGDASRETICESSARVEFTRDNEIVKHFKPRPKAIMELVTILEKGTKAMELGDKQIALEVEGETKALLNNPTLMNALNSDEEGKTKLVFNAVKSIEEGISIDSKYEISKLRENIKR